MFRRDGLSIRNRRWRCLLTMFPSRLNNKMKWDSRSRLSGVTVSWFSSHPCFAVFSDRRLSNPAGRRWVCCSATPLLFWSNLFAVACFFFRLGVRLLLT